MPVKIQKQTTTKTPRYAGDDEERYDHPGQGCVIANKATAGGKGYLLFGSELRHNQIVSLEIKEAEGYRGLHSDGHHARKTVCEVMLSEAQWAELVSSFGQGSGVPCTFRYKPAPGFKLEEVPLIDKVTMAEKFRSEIKDSVNNEVAELKELLSRIEVILSSGKRGGVKELLHDLKCKVENLPANMAFIQEQLHEAMDKVVADGKVEIEAFLRNRIHAAGLEQLTGGPPVSMIDSPGDKK